MPDGQTCQNCVNSYILFNGNCILNPTGVLASPNGGKSCMSGYSS
jgi:hypothetical protein